MNPTLFSEVQRLFERTYANVGINLEDCLIDRTRCRQLTRLAGGGAEDTTLKARLRRIDGEDFARNLELQGLVDTYLVLLLFVAFFRRTQKVSRTDRRWLKFHLFESRSADGYQDR